MIKNLYKNKKTIFSLEVFPPKTTDSLEKLYDCLDSFQTLKPDFISVTYGAGGSTSRKTIDIASYIQNTCRIEALAHLTCAALNETTLQEFLDTLKEHQVKNVLALRGDMPKDMTQEEFDRRAFLHASDLIAAILKNPFGSIGGACYPETHPEAASSAEDIAHLKLKAAAGADFFITQLFFDNNVFLSFMESLSKAGIDIPVSAGIMPITKTTQIKRIVELSGARLPTEMSHILSKYRDNPQDLKKAGLDYATRQIMDLLRRGVDGIHLYSMNQPDIAAAIYQNINLI